MVIEPEHPTSIKEFDPVITNPLHAEVISHLKEPTREGAYLDRRVHPKLWYGSVYGGRFDSYGNPVQEGRWEDGWRAFKEEYQVRSAENPALNDPYSLVDSSWNPASILTDENVRQRIEGVAETLIPAADVIRDWRSSPVTKMDKRFARDLREVSALLKEGKFDEAMTVIIKQPAEVPITWIMQPVESYDDPFKKRRSFEGVLFLNDFFLTQRLGSEYTKFEAAAKAYYGEAPFKAKVVAGRLVMLTGFLGEEEMRVQAFNIPNDPATAKMAGRTMICIFPGRIAKKVREKLQPALNPLLGVNCNVDDASRLVLAHEAIHGYRPEGEDERLGIYRSEHRELRATDGAVAVTSTRRYTSYYQNSVVRGSLAYAADDIGQYRTSVFEPLNQRQPTIDELRKDVGGYGVGGYIIIRQGVLHGALKKPESGRSPRHNFDKLIDLAVERDRELKKISESGTPQEAGRFLESLIDSNK